MQYRMYCSKTTFVSFVMALESCDPSTLSRKVSDLSLNSSEMEQVVYTCLTITGYMYM